MRVGHATALLAASLVCCLAVSAHADWFAADGHIMHSPQTPGSAPWLINATYPSLIADDYQAGQSGQIRSLHVWGGWRGNQEGEIRHFIVSIFSNSSGHPGSTRWERVITDFVVREDVTIKSTGWFDALSAETFPPSSAFVYQYNLFLDSLDWFTQTNGATYWLEISAVVADPVNTSWGWLSSPDLFGGNPAVSSNLGTCVAADNGAGTPDLVPSCPFRSPYNDIVITEGLPGGSSIEIDAEIRNISNVVESSGGTFGGNVQTFDAFLHVEAQGTGLLFWYSRTLDLPMDCETHTAPRMPGDSVQVAPGDIFRCIAELEDDDDFDYLSIQGGTDLGYPSPGTFAINRLASGDFAIDGLADVAFELQFVGASGSLLDGMADTTEGVMRIRQGELAPSVWGAVAHPDGPPDDLAMAFVVTDNGPRDGWDCDDPVQSPYTATFYEQEPNDDCVGSAIMIHGGDVVCGLLDNTDSADADWYRLVLPDSGECLAARVQLLGDDTPGFYCTARGANPTLAVYDDDCTTLLFECTDNNGALPDAVGEDAQYDADDFGNHFAPGAQVCCKVSGEADGDVAPYILRVSFEPCAQLGACCRNQQCYRETETGCAAAGGSFVGYDVTCSSDPCCCEPPTVGNVDGNAGVSLGDLTVLIDHLFVSFADLACPVEGNVDMSIDGAVSLGDLTVLIDHLFVSFQPLQPCPY